MPLFPTVVMQFFTYTIDDYCGGSLKNFFGQLLIANCYS